MAPRSTPPDAPADEAPDAPEAPEAAEQKPDEPPAGDATETPAPPSPVGEHAFFAWLRRLGVPRAPGWIGGVCAGIADRLGIDPLIVRGVAIVVAVLGGPAVLLYAVAWLLLPGPDGTIHAQELGRGRVTPAIPGVAALIVLSLLPIAQGFWFAGAFYWGDAGVAGDVLRALWVAALLTLGVLVVVWLARRSATAPDIRTVPPTTDDRPDSVPRLAFDAAPTTVGAPATGEPEEPPAPPADASAEELAAWRASQDEWQRTRAAWVADQRRAEREQRLAQARARAAEATAAAREHHRIQKLTRPRAGGGVVVLLLGLALLGAAVAAAIAHADPVSRPAAFPVGAAVATLVLGAGTVVVALARRRSGALAFFGILSLLVLGVAAVLPTDRTVLWPLVSADVDTSTEGRYARLTGSSYVWVPDRLPDGAEPTVIDLWQLDGTVSVDLQEGAAVRIELTTGPGHHWGRVAVTDDDGSRVGHYAVTGEETFVLGTGTPDVVLRVWMGPGVTFAVDSYRDERTPLEVSPEPESWNYFDAQGIPLPSPTPTPTGDAR